MSTTTGANAPQRGQRRKSLEQRQLRYLRQEDSNPGSSLYVDAQLLTWTTTTRQHIEKTQTCTDKELKKLWELLTSNDENVLLNATSCLKILWSIPHHPLRFHTIGVAADYVACIELIGSDNDLIVTNVLGLLRHASRENACCRTLLSSSSLLSNVLQYILHPTSLLERDALVLRALQEFVTSVLLTSSNTESAMDHFDTNDRLMAAGLYRTAIELSRSMYCTNTTTTKGKEGVNCTCNLLSALANITELDPIVASHLWFDVAIDLTSITTYFHLQLYTHQDGLHGIDNDGNSAVTQLNGFSKRTKQSLFVRSLRMMRNVVETAMNTKKQRGKRFAILKSDRMLTCKSIDAICTFVCMECQANTVCQMVDDKGEIARDVGVSLLWSVAMIECSVGGGGSSSSNRDGGGDRTKQRQNNTFVTNHYGLPLVTPNSTLEMFVEDLINTQEWRRQRNEEEEGKEDEEEKRW
jgi:hypothetical protein